VRDYDLVARTADGKEHTLTTVTGNFQRQRRHRFEALEIQSLRLIVHATNGDSLARVFELRCYP
jgi:hypothetical protein